MSEAQLREIPYKVVETNAKAMRVKQSPNSKQSQHSPRRNKRYRCMVTSSFTLKTELGVRMFRNRELRKIFGSKRK
jgi:hypothetical protein